MDNITAIAVSEKTVHPYELIIVTEASPGFLPHVTLVQAEGRSALLYSKNDLIPFSAFVKCRDKMDLGILFSMLTGYIRCLIEARDRMLNTSLISSDPEKGVFASQTQEGVSVKTVWGADAVPDENEKILRIVSVLSKCDRVMGAGTSMERMTQVIRSGNPSLKNCLAAAERVRREWNRIDSAPYSY